jgi:UDP-N-acetylglucosamine 4-epimerase
VAYGERTNLNQLVDILKTYLSEIDKEIINISPVYGLNREGDIPHSLASIEKAKKLLGYAPKYSVREGLKDVVQWYWENLR